MKQRLDVGLTPLRSDSSSSVRVCVLAMSTWNGNFGSRFQRHAVNVPSSGFVKTLFCLQTLSQNTAASGSRFFRSSFLSFV